MGAWAAPCAPVHLPASAARPGRATWKGSPALLCGTRVTVLSGLWWVDTSLGCWEAPRRRRMGNGSVRGKRASSLQQSMVSGT